MFVIYDGRESFYQWDLNRKLIVDDERIKEVHFCNKTDDCSLVCEVYEEDNLRLVNVPNILLQNDWRIYTYAYTDEFTIYRQCFEVERRSKPSDYVYTETEVKDYERVIKQIAEFEDSITKRVEAVEEIANNAVTLSEVIDVSNQQAEITVTNNNKVVANAINGYVIGDLICIDDISPLNNEMIVKATTKNLFVPNNLSATGTTTDSLTYIRNSDNTITLNGKSKYNSGVSVTFIVAKRIDLEEGIYTVSGKVGDTMTIYFVIKNSIKGTSKYYSTTNNKSITFKLEKGEYIDYMQLGYRCGLEFNNFNMIIQIEKGSVATTLTGAVNTDDIKVKQYGKNLLPYPYYTSNGKKQHGITITYLPNQGIIISGTPTFTSGVRDIVLAKNLALPTGEYTISGLVEKGSDATYKLYLRITKADGSLVFVNNLTGGSTFTISDGDLVEVDIRVGYEFTGSMKRLFPQIELGKNATKYEPYIFDEYIPKDGKITIEAYQPNSTLMVRNGAVMEVSYNKDTNKVIESLIQAIISMGGNI